MHSCMTCFPLSREVAKLASDVTASEWVMGKASWRRTVQTGCCSILPFVHHVPYGRPAPGANIQCFRRGEYQLARLLAVVVCKPAECVGKRGSFPEAGCRA